MTARVRLAGSFGLSCAKTIIQDIPAFRRAGVTSTRHVQSVCRANDTCNIEDLLTSIGRVGAACDADAAAAALVASLTSRFARFARARPSVGRNDASDVDDDVIRTVRLLLDRHSMTHIGRPEPEPLPAPEPLPEPTPEPPPTNPIPEPLPGMYR
jgi:hypothetical protein